MDQPQRRQARRRPRNDEHRAAAAERAREQHAKTRGYAVKPDLTDDYRNAFLQLRRRGLTRDETWAALRPEYAQEAAQ